MIQQICKLTFGKSYRPFASVYYIGLTVKLNIDDSRWVTLMNYSHISLC